jgi:hypothetical protein
MCSLELRRASCMALGGLARALPPRLGLDLASRHAKEGERETQLDTRSDPPSCNPIEAQRDKGRPGKRIARAYRCRNRRGGRARAVIGYLLRRAA